MTEENAPEQAPEPEKAAPAKPETGKRYAAYDKTLAKFVGGVHGSRKAAEAHAKKIRDAGRSAEIREV